MNQGIQGDPVVMRALAEELSKSASTAQMLMLRAHAHIEEARARGQWADSNQEEFTRRLSAIRDTVDPQLTKVLLLAMELHGLSERYAKLLSGR